MKYRAITITPCLNGFVISIGCQTAVFNEYKDMLNQLTAYYNDPIETEKKYLDNNYRQETILPPPTITTDAYTPGLSETAVRVR